jgi:hypothetical protein
MRKHWFIGGFAGVMSLGLVLVFLGAQDAGDAGQEAGRESQGAAETLSQGGATFAPAESYPSGQPIAFPHNQHSGMEEGQNQMDCMYCHFSAERSKSSGIPPVQLCMGCHQVINGADEAAQAEINKLRGYWERGEPIPWVRIYKISDHAHFPHMRHINAGLECQQCHGEVQNMAVINERDPAWGDGKMGWCIDCHRQEGASIDCAVCHY